MTSKNIPEQTESIHELTTDEMADVQGGKVKFKDFTITKLTDASSPTLML